MRSSHRVIVNADHLPTSTQLGASHAGMGWTVQHSVQTSSIGSLRPWIEATLNRYRVGLTQIWRAPMGKVIVVTSGKGGVGKTTSTAALGASLARAGQKVVVVDFDVCRLAQSRSRDGSGTARLSPGRAGKRHVAAARAAAGRRRAGLAIRHGHWKRHVVAAGPGVPSGFGAAAGEVAGCCTMAAPKNTTIITVKGSAVTVALRTLSIRVADVSRSPQVLRGVTALQGPYAQWKIG
jgi:CobQ/CobB/MinD/ParA nucleotide binding domain